MSLTITQTNKNVFSLQGSLNASTASNFYNHFKGVLSQVQNLNINIECVNDVDNNGLLAFYKLYKNAAVFNKQLTVNGNGNQAIYNMLNHYNKIT